MVPLYSLSIFVYSDYIPDERVIQTQSQIQSPNYECYELLHII